ncbi:MAG: hypothetical protein WAU68_00865 [Vitreimonas sp.]
MTQPPKKPLSLLTDQAQEERRVTLNVVDTLLPCRFFEIDHKVAVLGKASLTTELILRLLKAADGINEENAAAFFGFDLREMNFVLGEAESLGYIERRDGALWITSAGSALFRDGAAEPEIFEVEKRTERCGFDLIAFAPQRGAALSGFERRLPELPLGDAKYAARGSSAVPDAFRKHFLELARERDLGRRSLYSVDEVRPGDRFSSVVRIVVTVSNLRPSQPEIDLNEWRPEDEQEDRKEIRMSAAAFVHELQTAEAASNQGAYEALVAIAPEFLKDFVRRDGLSVARYFREMLGRAGDVRIDRPTIPIVGSLFVPDNFRRFVEVLSYGLRSKPPAKGAIWCAPSIPQWGAIADLPDLLLELGHRVSGPDEQEFETVCLLPRGVDEWRAKQAFTRVGVISDQRTSPALECLLVPGVACAVLVNAPIGAAHGYPVGLGIMSFDAEVVARATDLVMQAAPSADDLRGLLID